MQMYIFVEKTHKNYFMFIIINGHLTGLFNCLALRWSNVEVLNLNDFIIIPKGLLIGKSGLLNKSANPAQNDDL